jgi:WD40 repeat protein
VHEALIQKWGKFREWMRADRAFRSWQERLRDNLRQWQESGQDNGALLRGAPLAVAQNWLGERGDYLSQVEMEYIRESQSLQVRLQQENDRRRRATFLALGTGLVVALLLTAFALFQRQNALTQRQNAQLQAAILLSSQAEAELANGYHDRAVLLALEALEKYPYIPQAEHALGQAVTYTRALRQCKGFSNAVTSLAWSSDGKLLAASSGNENRVRIWDAATCQEQLTIDLPTSITGNKLDMGLSVRWTPDGKNLLTLTGDRLVTGSQDYNLILWDAISGIKISTVKIPNQADPESGDLASSVTHYPTGAAIDFAPGSHRLATLGGDNTAIIWDTTFQTPQQILVGHTNDVNSVAWSPDGSRLVTASLDGSARTWDGKTGKTLLVLQGHTGRVNHALWSPDGKTIATAGEDGTARLWDAQSGELLRTIETNAGIVWSLAWSPDGARLVTGHEDASLRFWEKASGKLLETLRGPDTLITHLAWSPTDQRLASADANGLVRIWNAAVSTALISFPYMSTAGQMDFSHDGGHLALPSGANFPPFEEFLLTVVDLTSTEPSVKPLATNPQNGWFYVIYSSDDQKLLTFGIDAPWPDMSAQDTAYVFDSRTGKTLKALSLGDENLPRSIGWSPDDSQVATGMLLSGNIIIWDYRTGEQIAILTLITGHFNK